VSTFTVEEYRSVWWLKRYDEFVSRPKLEWQSKTILLLVFPYVGADVVLETHWWGAQMPTVAVWTLGLSVLLGMAAWKLRSATPGAALAGMAITASLMFATVSFPYKPWKTALTPVLVLLVMTSISTRLGRRYKESLGTAESKQGRSASQVAANLGVSALVSSALVLSWLMERSWLHVRGAGASLALAIGLAALAEAAADTISSEIGQVVSGYPRMITTLRSAEPGTDGAISVGGTVAGIAAAGLVSGAGAWALNGGWMMLAVSWSSGVFGLLFDSMLGATAEQRGWINNDAVNFLSTASAAGFAVAMLAVLPIY